MNLTYKACQSCAVLITNGDDSHINPAVLPDILDSVEAMGPVTQSEILGWHHFTCECCGATAYAMAYTYEGADFDPPAPDTRWMRDLRAILESVEFDAVEKLEIIREMMPDNPHTFTF